MFGKKVEGKNVKYVRTTLTLRRDVLEKIEKLIGTDLKFVKLSPVVDKLLEIGIQEVVREARKKGKKPIELL